jgi:enoyl-CoA hydratase/carnithine racemase
MQNTNRGFPYSVKSFSELSAIVNYELSQPDCAKDFNYSGNRFSCDDVKIKLYENGTLWMLLNRGKELNALTIDMYIALTTAYVIGYKDLRVKCFIISSENEKVFCAGGDIKNLSPFNPNSKQYSPYFRACEINFLRLTRELTNKPLICLMQGAVIGGAFTLYTNATYSVANLNRFSLSLPETKNGLVGTPETLHRCISVPLLTYFLLTSITVGPLDAVYNGHITHVSKDDISFHYLARELKTKQFKNTEKDLSNIIMENCLHGDALLKHIDRCHFAQVRNIVEETFNEKTIQAILYNLKTKINSESVIEAEKKFCQETLNQLRNMSPSSLILTMAIIAKYAYKDSKSIGYNIMPYEIAIQKCVDFVLRSQDFQEAVRHILILKDRQKPTWKPWNSIEDVSIEESNKLVGHVLDEFSL